MAEVFIADNPAIALVAGTAKSVLCVGAASTQPFRVVQSTVGTDSLVSGIIKVEFLVGTASGGTTGTAPNVARMNADSLNKVPLASASYYTAEPTWTKYASNGSLAIKTFALVAPSTPYDIEYPLGREFICPVSNTFVIRLTATSISPNAYVTLAFEE